MPNKVFKLPATRWGAFAGHLLISLLIFLALFLLIALFLFPGALFRVAGGIGGIKIIAAVDLVLGPLLTLIIYNKAKPRKELYRDLTIIGSIQFIALCAGMSVVYQSRPAVVAYVLDTFYTAKAGEFAKSENELPRISFFTPSFYAVDLPRDDEEAGAIVIQHAMAGESLHLRSDLYKPLEGISDDEQKELLRIDPAIDGSDQCLRRPVATHFQTETLCFDRRRHRFSSPDAATSEEAE